MQTDSVRFIDFTVTPLIPSSLQDNRLYCASRNKVRFLEVDFNRTHTLQTRQIKSPEWSNKFLATIIAQIYATFLVFVTERWNLMAL